MTICKVFIGSFLHEHSKMLLYSVLERREFKKGEIILHQGEVTKHIYIVERGIMRQYYFKDDKYITEHFSTDSEVASCLESLFLKEPTKIMIEAIEPSVIYLLDFAKWESLCDKGEVNLVRLYRKMMEYMLVVSQQKSDSLRFESTNERYKRFCKEYSNIINRVPIADIASYLNMSAETLSRIRSQIK